MRAERIAGLSAAQEEWLREHASPVEVLDGPPYFRVVPDRERSDGWAA